MIDMRPSASSLLAVLVLATPLAADAQTTSGFDATALDKTIAPCDDFYKFACGGWLARNPVPADRARWGRFDELSERNHEALQAILEKAAVPTPSRTPVDQKIGDYYATCMDEAGIEAKGVAALAPVLARIDAVKTPADLAREVARQQREGANVFFRFGAQADFKDASMHIAVLDQGGLGLPDRDYYLKDEPRFKDVRDKYTPHVQRMFELLGEAPEAAQAHAKTVLSVETALAQGFLERVKRRDPLNRDHKMTKAAFVALAPRFDWTAYFAAAEGPAFSEANVGWPDFFKALDAQLQARPLSDWKTYLRWQAVRNAAPLLPAAFVQQDFDFYRRTLTGAKELRPRWKRCVEIVDDQLGEALGQRYVEATFGAEGKARMAKMVAALEHALKNDLEDLPWMTPATKKQALGKLAAIANKIGYPDTWRDYASVQIVRGDALGNSARATAFESARDLRKIGQKVDPREWDMTPPTVNAYYNPPENNINFPAGLLQPPFFEKSMDDAVNFGAIGSVIGHELTHGFDDQGRKFAANGNLTDWWTDEDAREFEKRATCVADQYSGYTVVGDVKLNGRLTLGENTADNGGVRIAYMALLETLAGAPVPLKDGFTPEQRLFLGWGQIWCQNETDESARLRAQTDPHSPGRYRVNGPLSNMPEFQKAFSCPTGSPMVREPACRVW